MMNPEHGKLERLTFFSDAVFAIAITLLIIEVRVPEIHQLSDVELQKTLLQLTPKYIGWLVSFFVIGRYWVGHHRLFGMLEGFDPKLVWANLLFLLTIAFMPFPTAVFSEYLPLRTAVSVYTLWLLFAALLNARLVGLALGKDAHLAPGVSEADRSTLLRGRWGPIAIALTALIAGLIQPQLSLVFLLGGPLILWAVRGRWRR